MTDDKKKWRYFWMDTDLLDKALDACDLGDGYMAKVRQYPHVGGLPYYTKVIEYAAFKEAKTENEALKLQVKLLSENTLHEVTSLKHDWTLMREALNCLLPCDCKMPLPVNDVKEKFTCDKCQTLAQLKHKEEKHDSSGT